MSFTVTDAFIQQFTGNVKFLAQQTDTRIRKAVYEESITGEAAYIEQLAPTAARRKQSRHGDTPVMNTQHLRRRIAPYDYEWSDIVDQLDKVRLLIDPTSAYATNAASAINRAIDDEIISAFFATAYTGHSGSTAVTWPNGNSESAPTAPAGAQISVSDWSYGNGSGNVGLTISKLISASVALDQAEGDIDEERFIIVGGKQKGNLLATTEATSADYNSVQALVEGKINTFMGFTFIHSERLLTDASGYTRVPVFRKSGIGLGVAKDIWTMCAQDPGKSYSWRPYAAISIGAARLEEPKIVELKCL